MCFEEYISHIKTKGERSSLFNENNIAMYAVMFHDDKIIADAAEYVKQIMITFDLLTCWQQIHYEQISCFVFHILLVTVDVGLIM